MKEQYLVFDSGCFTCSSFAATVEREARGKLKAIGIDSEMARTLLKRAFPNGWDHQPYLLTVRGSVVTASTGPKMMIGLGHLLGPRKGWYIYALAREAGIRPPVKASSNALGRRSFLQKAAALGAGLLFIGTSGPNARVFAAQDANTNLLPPHLHDDLLGIVRRSSVFLAYTSQLGTGFAPAERADVRQQGGSFFVSIAMLHQGNPTHNVFTAVIDGATRQIVHTGAYLITETSAGHHVRHVWDNQLVLDATFDEQGNCLGGFAVKGGHRIEIAGQNYVDQGRQVLFPQGSIVRDGRIYPATLQQGVPTFNPGIAYPEGIIDCLGKCLSSMGVAGWLAGLVGIVCGFLCSNPWTAVVCLQCLVSELGISLSIATWCVFVCTGQSV